MFRLGLIINPLAGLGGPVALKGSDGVAALARERGGRPAAATRALRTLVGLEAERERIELKTWDGAMGADVARAAGFAPAVLGAADGNADGAVAGASDTATTAADTIRAARTLAAAGCDLLLFVGGDGTARDLVAALDPDYATQPVLGIPAGVKMHSGVFAVTPEAAARLVLALATAQLVGVGAAEVRDIDEEGYRAGQVRARHFGELQVPTSPGWVQQTKVSGRESEPLVLEEIGAWIAEQMAAEPNLGWIVGPGSTTAAILAHQGLTPTLLGVDLVVHGQIEIADATAEQLLARVGAGSWCILVTAIGGQGHVLGRGNQQLSAELVQRVGREHFRIVATRSKLDALGGRPLLVDSGDPELDARFVGHVAVITGYEDEVLYPIGIDAVVHGEPDGAADAGVNPP